MTPGAVDLTYRRAPSALLFMTRAMFVPALARGVDPLPSLSAAWNGHRVAGEAFDSFLDLTDLADSAYWPLLYPLVVGFRLQMVVLTHPRFPYPIWSALQIRNRALLHEAFGRDAVVDLRTTLHARRGVEKGTEVDLKTTAHSGGKLVWECVNTFYYRGIRSKPGDGFQAPVAPTVEGPLIARWTVPRAPRWRFGALTGDYNGIHMSRHYARLFGFRDAFLHPQRVLGNCAAHLPRDLASTPLRLDAWLKGPVYYGSELALRVDRTGDAAAFAVQVGSEDRPAIVGRLAHEVSPSASSPPP